MFPYQRLVISILRSFQAGSLRPVPRFLQGRKGRILSAVELIQRFTVYEMTVRLMGHKLDYIARDQNTLRLFVRAYKLMVATRSRQDLPLTRRELLAIKTWAQTLGVTARLEVLDKTLGVFNDSLK